MQSASVHTPSNKATLLRDLLKQVSRLFYTTLVVVPANVRDQVGLAYLFARAADTIADTELISHALVGQIGTHRAWCVHRSGWRTR
ncbi:MAG: squalene/phytoene synthase family protein [Nitrospira sp.]|nr:squalene/phytoene synthase family protein [Nitrospira sp.]